MWHHIYIKWISNAIDLKLLFQLIPQLCTLLYVIFHHNRIAFIPIEKLCCKYFRYLRLFSTRTKSIIFSDISDQVKTHIHILLDFIFQAFLSKTLSPLYLRFFITIVLLVSFLNYVLFMFLNWLPIYFMICVRCWI